MLGKRMSYELPGLYTSYGTAYAIEKKNFSNFCLILMLSWYEEKMMDAYFMFYMSSQSQRDAWSWHKAILLDKPLSWCSSFRQIFNLAIANTSKNLKGHWSAPAAARQTRVCGLQPGREYSLGVAARGQLALSLTTKVVVFTDHYAPPPPSPLVVRHTPKFARRSEIISGLYPTLPLTFFVNKFAKDIRRQWSC